SKATSVRPSPSKSPGTTWTPATLAQPPKSATGSGWLTTRNEPSPLENATGTDVQPAPPTSAMSVNPSLSKSPVTTCAPGAWAHPAKLAAALFDTANVPSPLAIATGIVDHPDPPTSATSVIPSRLKLPVTVCTPIHEAQPLKLPVGAS